MRYSLIQTSLLVALLVQGCASTLRGPQAYLPEQRPLGGGLQIAGETPSAASTVEIAGSELTLSRALSRVLLYNPELAVFSWELRVREAEALQAGLLPNPELEFGLESVASNEPFSDPGTSETSISLSQLLRLGGKGHKSRKAARLQTELAGWDFETRRLDVLTLTATTFVGVLAAQMQVELADELAELSERFYRTVTERVTAGESSPVEQTRAQVTLAASHIARDQARLSLEMTRNELAALWGDDTATFERAVGSLEQVDPVPPLEQLSAFLDQNPDIARWETEAELQTAQVSLERANAIPDLTLTAGVTNYRETDDKAFVIGASIPFPLFNRNQGGIAAARAAHSKIRQESQAARHQARLDLASSYSNLVTARFTATTLQEQILPAASDAFAAVDFGYRAGRFSFLEVLDAQRTLFEVREQQIEALAAYHQARASVERLIGAPLQAITPTQ